MALAWDGGIELKVRLRMLWRMILFLAAIFTNAAVKFLLAERPVR
jgi:hypothetical protein